MFGAWTVLDQFRRSYLSSLCIYQGTENSCAGGKVFGSVLGYFNCSNFSLVVFLSCLLKDSALRTRT